MADKTIALKIAIEGNAELKQLQANFTATQRELKSLERAEKKGIITAKEANDARASLNVQLKANRNALTDQQNALLKNNDALKKNSGFVAGVKKGVGQWATSMIGVGVAIAGITSALKDASQRILKFDSSIKNLSAITGATGKDLDFLKKQAIELGKSTTLTASEVADAFTKIGSQRPELLKNKELLASVTEETIRLSEASKIDLDAAAKAVATSLNQMSLDATETARVVNVLAAGSKEGAADIPFLNAAIEKSGAVARDANLSFEEMVGAIETIAPSISDPSSAGLQFRDVLLRLQQSGKGFESGQFDLKDALTQVKGEFEAIKDPIERSKAETNLFGKVSIVTGKALLDNIDKFEGYTEAVTGTNVAFEQQAKNNDTLEATFKKLDSAYEGLILTLESGDGVLSNTIKGYTNLAANIINLVTSLESAEGRMKAVNQIGADFLVMTGAMTKEQATFQQNLANNTNLLDELEKRFENQEITLEQYQKAIKKIGDGWKSTKQEVTDNPIEAKVDVTIGEEEVTTDSGSVLSDAEKEKIKKKAEEKAKLLKDLERQEAEDVSSEESEIIDFDLELEELRARNEAKLFVDKEFIDATRLQHDEAMAAEIDAAKKNAEDVKKFEELKRNARMASVQLLADTINMTTLFAKEGSMEQKALSSALALVQTYQAAQAAYASQLSIPSPSAPFRAAAAAAVAVASGLANVAKINAVQFAEGGVLKGNSHAMGGIPFTVNGVGGFEAEGGEAIINKRSTAMFTPLLSAINEAGGGRRLFQEGGLTPSINGLSTSQSILNNGNTQEDLAEIIAGSINSIEVVNVATNTSQVANEVVNVSNNAKF